MEKLVKLFEKMQELNDNDCDSSWYRIIIHPNGQCYLVKCPGNLNAEDYPRETVARVVTSIDLGKSLPLKAGPVFSAHQILI